MSPWLSACIIAVVQQEPNKKYIKAHQSCQSAKCFVDTQYKKGHVQRPIIYEEQLQLHLLFHMQRLLNVDELYSGIIDVLVSDLLVNIAPIQSRSPPNGSSCNSNFLDKVHVPEQVAQVRKNTIYSRTVPPIVPNGVANQIF